MRNYALNPHKDDIGTWTRFTHEEQILVSLDEQLAMHGLEVVWGFLDNNDAVYVKVEPRMTIADRDFYTRLLYDL